ncbi:hypothetical protein BSL78_00515 [Apostichopus japonicus]|uniref:Uncharacterized protein n=1 Tax=Stichopus japonicus TaxID=307972 RepID=A0A2G8LQH1_STIJA|nr:hypothetical protein BSL78_00515 [Apostichopus japonicus]
MFGPRLDGESLHARRQHELLLNKLARTRSDIVFLSQCKQLNIVPKGLRIRNPLHSGDKRIDSISDAICSRASHQLRNHALKFAYTKQNRLSKELIHTKDSLQNLVPDTAANKKVLSALDTTYRRDLRIVFKRKLRKLEQLTTQDPLLHHLQSTGHPYITNINSKDTQPTLHVPNTKSSWTPPEGRNRFIDSFACKAKTYLDKFILENAKRPLSSNVNRTQSMAIKKLRNNPDVVIRQADKGGATTILNTTDYIFEAEKQLSNSDFYKILPEDPSRLFQPKIDELCQSVPQHVATKIAELTPKDPSLGTFYTLPKVHKLPKLITEAQQALPGVTPSDPENIRRSTFVS